MPLTDTAIKALKPESKARKHADERGLFLLVQPTGGKLWRFKYRFDGKEKLIAFVAYPDVGLKAAREKRDEARKLIASGADPSEERKASKGGTTISGWSTPALASESRASCPRRG